MNPARAFAASLVFGGCTDTRAFPDGFSFGTAVAGFQVDMGCPTIAPELCEDRASDWYQFVTSTAAIARSGTHLSGEPMSFGPGFFELYEQDLDRAKAIGTDSFRFSVEWSRLFPESTIGVEGHEALKAKASPAALDYYRKLLAALRARGMKPLVTLHHYTLPSWIHDGVGCTLRFTSCAPRGWLDPAIIPEVTKYAGFVAKELGGEIDHYATLNEPLAAALFGYLQPLPARTHPPAQSLLPMETKSAVLRMIEAHARMVDAVRENDVTDADGDGKATYVGVVYPVVPVLPKDPSSPLDVRAAENISYLYNDLFLNAVIDGELDDDLDGRGDLRADLAGRSDYLGLNYYFKIVVEGETSSLLPDFSPLLTLDPLTLEQGATHPSGLRDVLVKIKRDWPSVPVYITENGWDTSSGYAQERFLAEHLQWTLRAIHEDGVDVRGYFWWSLMDNYEWNHGMRMRFGLWAVDPMDPMKTRTPRPVVADYQAVISAKAVPASLVERFPVE